MSNATARNVVAPDQHLFDHAAEFLSIPQQHLSEIIKDDEVTYHHSVTTLLDRIADEDSLCMFDRGSEERECLAAELKEHERLDPRGFFHDRQRDKVREEQLRAAALFHLKTKWNEIVKTITQSKAVGSYLWEAVVGMHKRECRRHLTRPRAEIGILKAPGRIQYLPPQDVALCKLDIGSDLRTALRTALNPFSPFPDSSVISMDDFVSIIIPTHYHNHYDYLLCELQTGMDCVLSLTRILVKSDPGSAAYPFREAHRIIRPYVVLDILKKSKTRQDLVRTAVHFAKPDRDDEWKEIEASLAHDLDAAWRSCGYDETSYEPKRKELIVRYHEQAEQILKSRTQRAATILHSIWISLLKFGPKALRFKYTTPNGHAVEFTAEFGIPEPEEPRKRIDFPIPKHEIWYQTRKQLKRLADTAPLDS